jgi:hypothetical protein
VGEVPNHVAAARATVLIVNLARVFATAVSLFPDTFLDEHCTRKINPSFFGFYDLTRANGWQRMRGLAEERMFGP